MWTQWLLQSFPGIYRGLKQAGWFAVVSGIHLYVGCLRIWNFIFALIRTIHFSTDQDSGHIPKRSSNCASWLLVFLQAHLAAMSRNRCVTSTAKIPKLASVSLNQYICNALYYISFTVVAEHHWCKSTNNVSCRLPGNFCSTSSQEWSSWAAGGLGTLQFMCVLCSTASREKQELSSCDSWLL